MPFKEPGTDEVLERVTSTSARGLPTRRTRKRSFSRSARPRCPTSRSTSARSVRCSTTCCRCCAPGSCSSCAPPSGRARRSSWPATWRSGAASRSARTCSWPMFRSGSRPTASSRSRHAALHRRRRRRRLRRARCAAVRGARRADRADHAGAGRAREDLDQHPALHDVRAPQSADDGLRALRRERVRRRRPHQPRLSAPRDGHAGLTAGTCLRKDFAFSEEKSNAPGMLLGVSRVHESVPLFLVDGVKRRLGGSLRERKVAVLGLAFKRDTDDERTRFRTSSSGCLSASWPTSWPTIRSWRPRRRRSTRR